MIPLPKLNHSEVNAFYEYDLSIPREKVEAILALPKETLVQDLETLLLDAIERYDFFKNFEDKDKWWEFPTHALYVLIELKAKESLPTILKLLQQEEDFTSYWFGDSITENFWQVLYYLGEGAFPLLKDLILQPGNWVNRIVPATALAQIGLHQPEKKEAIIAWFDEVLTAFLAMKEEDISLDGEVIASIVCDLMSLRAKELLPKIKALYDRGLIYAGITGNYAAIKKDISGLDSAYEKHKIIHSIFDRYEDVMAWHGYRMRYDEAYKKKNTYAPPKAEERDSSVNEGVDYSSFPLFVETVKRVGEKVGRNEPCPCGSGKKYKKCCWKK